MPVHTGHTNAIVPGCGNGSRHMSPVIVVIQGISVVVDEVIAVNIVDESIAVIVESVAWHLTGIDPHVCREIFVTIVDPCVDHRHDGLAAADGRIPGFGRIHIGVDGSVRLTLVVQAPLLAKPWIVGRGTHLNSIDGLGVEN